VHVAREAGEDHRPGLAVDGGRAVAAREDPDLVDAGPDLVDDDGVVPAVAGEHEIAIVGDHGRHVAGQQQPVFEGLEADTVGVIAGGAAAGGRSVHLTLLQLSPPSAVRCGR